MILRQKKKQFDEDRRIIIYVYVKVSLARSLTHIIFHRSHQIEEQWLAPQRQRFHNVARHFDLLTTHDDTDVCLFCTVRANSYVS